jgi:hypothetical protein
MAIIGDPIEIQAASYAGQLVAQMPGFRASSALRSSTGTKRLLRCTVTAPTSGQTFTIRGRAPGLPWREASYTTDSTSAADLRDGLVAAWAATDGVDFANVSAAASGIAIDAEALAPGDQNPIEFEVVADPTDDLSAFAVIAAGSFAFTAQFGRYLDVSGFSQSSDAQRPVIAELTAVTGDSIATTIAVDTENDTFAMGVVFDGDLVPVTWDAGTDTATTVPVAVAAIQAALPDATVSGVTGTGVITIAAPVGIPAYVVSETAQGSSTISSQRTVGDDAPDVTALVYDDGGAESLTIGSQPTGYAGRQSVAFVSLGFRLGVERPGETVTGYAPVWVETAAGSDKGRPFMSPSNTRFKHPTHKWLADGSSAAVIGG